MFCRHYATRAIARENSQSNFVFLIQVEEVSNISESSEYRRNESKNRTLKILLTDGLSTLAGLEVRCIKELSTKIPAGSKVLCQDFEVRHGMALFGPDNLKLLGGMVMELERSRLEQIERIESAKKRRQLVPAMPPSAPDAPHDAESQNPTQGRAVHLPVAAASLELHDASTGYAPHMPPPRPAADHTRFAASAANAITAGHGGGAQALTRTSPAPRAAGPDLTDEARSEPQALAAPPAQSSEARATSSNAIEDVFMTLLDSEEERQDNFSGATLRQLAYLSSFQSSADRIVVPRWVRAVAMGAEGFSCNPAAGGYSVRICLVDGTGSVMVRVCDAVLLPLAGIPSEEYARLSKHETRPIRTAVSARLLQTEAQFLLAPMAGDADGGLEVLEMDESGGGGAARALLERVEVALAAGDGPLATSDWR